MILFGHRGAKGEAPENTMTGFAYARRVGVRAFEIDVRLTADHEVILLHDASVDRTTDGSGAAAELTWAQIAALDARAGFRDWPEPCRVPMLEEFLSVYADSEIARLEIEIKRDTPERLEILSETLISLIGRYGVADRIMLSSFAPDALRTVRRIAPELPRSYIGAYDHPHFLETALDLGCAQADIPLKTGSLEMVRAAHAHDLRVTGWPGNTREEIEALIRWEVDGITTDFPSQALGFLEERG